MLLIVSVNRDDRCLWLEIFLFSCVIRNVVFLWLIESLSWLNDKAIEKNIFIKCFSAHYVVE